MKYSAFIIVAALILAGGMSFFWAGYVSNDVEESSESIERRLNRVTVTDGFDHKVSIETPVERVTSCYSAFTAILESLGAVNVIKGATRKQAKRLDVQSVGTHLKPDVEAIVATEPELVLISANRKQVVRKVERRLEGTGAKLLAIHPHTIEGMLQRMMELGKLVGRKAAAETKMRDVKKVLQRIDKKVKGLESKRPKVFFEVRSSPSLLTCGKDAIAYDIIQRAGGKPVYDRGGSVEHVDTELVVDRAPDAYIQQKGVMNPDPVPPKKHPVLQSLECVQNGRVLQVEEKRMSRPTPEVIKALRRVHRFLFKGDSQGL